jgi:hypothetical protein
MEASEALCTLGQFTAALARPWPRIEIIGPAAPDCLETQKTWPQKVSAKLTQTHKALAQLTDALERGTGCRKVSKFRRISQTTRFPGMSHRRRRRTAFASDSDSDDDSEDVAPTKPEATKPGPKKPRRTSQVSSKEQMLAKKPAVKRARFSPLETASAPNAGAAERDAAEDWTEARRQAGLVVSVSRAPAPSNFEDAMAWILTSARREQMFELIGALNLPTTPFKINDNVKSFRRWWERNRKTLQQRAQTFVVAVTQIHTRQSETNLQGLHLRHSLQERHMLVRQAWTANFLADAETLSVGETVWAVIWPVDGYGIHPNGSSFQPVSSGLEEQKRNASSSAWPGFEDPEVPVRSLSRRTRFLTDIKEKAKQTDVADSVAAICRPVLCRVTVGLSPDKSEARLPAGSRAWIPRSRTGLRLKTSASIHFLARPPKEIQEQEERVRMYSWNPNNVRSCTIPVECPLWVCPPCFSAKPFKWRAMLRLNHIPNANRVQNAAPSTTGLGLDQSDQGCDRRVSPATAGAHVTAAAGADAIALDITSSATDALARERWQQGPTLARLQSGPAESDTSDTSDSDCDARQYAATTRLAGRLPRVSNCQRPESHVTICRTEGGRDRKRQRVGVLELMPAETRRYNQLVAMFRRCAFVTSEPAVWTIIAEYQLLP